MRRSIFFPLALGSVLLACPEPKESETTATTGESGDDSIGHSSNPQSGTAPTGVTTSASNTTVPPDPTGGPVETTDPTIGGSTTASPEETTSTTGEECVPDPPDPKQCNKVKHADDPDVFGASSGVVFIETPDFGGGKECDVFEQNCPEGEKCNAWSSDGDNSWDSLKCVPVVPNPDPIGAPCFAEGGGISGVDSCVKGAMCWGVDSQTGMGTCVEQCTCSAENPICAVTPNSSCLIANDGVIVLCLPSCDPLDADACAGGEVCVPDPGDSSRFTCVFDASGEEGALGDPCSFANGCDPTLMCGEPGLLPAMCDLSEPGCCLPFCDLRAIDCPQGADCLPWFEEGQAPKCSEHIGVCGTLP